MGTLSEVLKHWVDYRFRIEVWATLSCGLLGIAVMELVRRRRLQERYSLLWFLTAGVLFTLALRRDWLEDFAKLMGIYYAPSALFLVLVFFMLLILIHFSTVVSGLLSDRQMLAQKVGILEARVRSLEKEEAGPFSVHPHTSNTQD